MEVLFYRHQTSSQKKKGTCTIYCRLTIEGQRVEIGTTHIKVRFEDFDTQTQQIINDYNASEFNFQLEHEFKSKIYSIYNRLLLKNEIITARKIRELFNQVSQTPKTLIQIFDQFLEEFKKKTVVKVNNKKEQVAPQRSDSTLRPLTVCRNKLLNYLISINQVQITTDDLDERFFHQYEQYLFAVPHKQPTVVKHLRTLRQITKFAKREKWIEYDPFAEMEVAAEQIQDPKYLTQEQMLFWIHFDFSSKVAQEVADFFSLCCLTGFHFMDMVQDTECLLT